MWLRQGTARTIKMGPFLDSTDGNTVEPSLTIQKADVRISKNGGNYASASADQGVADAGAPYDETGEYDIDIDTTDTDTLGFLKVVIHKSGALSVWRLLMVVSANVWDSLFGVDKLQVHMVEITNDLITAAAMATDSIDANALAADAVAEIVNGINGPGVIEWTYTLTNEVGGAPIGDADIWVTTDVLGENTIASGRTNQNGQVTFTLDAGTVYVWRQKSGWNFTNPDTETVS